MNKAATEMKLPPEKPWILKANWKTEMIRAEWLYLDLIFHRAWDGTELNSHIYVTLPSKGFASSASDYTMVVMGPNPSILVMLPRVKGEIKTSWLGFNHQIQVQILLQALIPQAKTFPPLL